jgi:hypothetical protein
VNVSRRNGGSLQYRYEGAWFICLRVSGGRHGLCCMRSGRSSRTSSALSVIVRNAFYVNGAGDCWIWTVCKRKRPRFHPIPSRPRQSAGTRIGASLMSWFMTSYANRELRAEPTSDRVASWLERLGFVPELPAQTYISPDMERRLRDSGLRRAPIWIRNPRVDPSGLKE